MILKCHLIYLNASCDLFDFISFFYIFVDYNAFYRAVLRDYNILYNKKNKTPKEIQDTNIYLNRLDYIELLHKYKFKNSKIPKYTSQDFNRMLSTPEWSDGETPLFINIFPELAHIKRLPEVIFVNKQKYLLESASIGFKMDESYHAIAGLRCRDVFYVYDSNNVLAETNWVKGNLSKYLIELKKTGMNADIFSLSKYYNVLYIKHLTTNVV